jgi:homocysteine S-methyltransferase
VAGDTAYVAGAIGPLGVRIEPWGKTGIDEAREFFREQAAALVEGGVDLLMLETFRDWNEAAAAVDAARSVCTLPIVALVTTEEDGNSHPRVRPGRVRAEPSTKPTRGFSTRAGTAG